MVYRRGIMAASAVMISALALGGCGSSSPSPAAAPPVQPSAPLLNTPRAAAAEMLDAYRNTDIGRFCAVVLPSQQAACNSAALANAFATVRVSNVAIHRTAISGDRALVSITGKLCLAGRCQAATDPNSGMPSATVSFERAWRIAASPQGGTTAGSPFERINGRWYLVLT